MARVTPGTVWARGFGVTLRPLAPGALDTPGMHRALGDGIERNYQGDLPGAPAGLECRAIHAAGAVVGVLAFRRDVPRHGAVVFDCVAVAPEHRGRAYAARALLLAERRLGAADYYGRVPRTNGRGLYFMLRCGYTPVSSPIEDGATWFRRHLPREALQAPSRPAAGRRGRQPSARASTAGS